MTSSQQQNKFLKIAVPTPLRRCFDYLAPTNIEIKSLQPGIRIRVPFGSQKIIGILVGVTDETNVPKNKLRSILEIIDGEPLIPSSLLKLCHWTSDYYQHSLGDVFSTALPFFLRQGKKEKELQKENAWRLTELGKTIEIDSLKRATKQKLLIELLQENLEGISKENLKTKQINSTIIKTFKEKNWIEPCALNDEQKFQEKELPLSLNEEQEHVVQTIKKYKNKYQCFLLDGVTGSGKTEIYLRIIEECIADKKQSLVLVPEIGLTPQLVSRFQKRFSVPIAVLHSGLSDGDRARAWLQAKNGDVSIIIGTRSAIFTPLLNPGLIVVDEEHDASFKQQDNLRYSARDLAVVRARMENIPIILGTATPSLESLHNAKRDRYQLLTLTKRAGVAVQPTYHVIDVRGQRLQHGLSSHFISVIEKHLSQGNQILLFINRRGFAPILMCHECGWVADCQNCDAHLILHKTTNKLHCHHCGSTQTIFKQCPSCNSQSIFSFGVGTQRLEEGLQKLFSQHRVIRIDQDTTRRKGSFENLLNDIHDGHGQILVGTQMLAKGHHFPNVTLVGILNADSGLYSADFRATEHMAQLLMQVAGRAGREEKTGEVYIQTRHPHHPLLLTLIKNGYHACCDAMLNERHATNLPPLSHLALFRTDAKEKQQGLNFLEKVKHIATQLNNGAINNSEKNIGEKNIFKTKILGPIPSPQERLIGKYRAQLLLQSNNRQQLQKFLALLISNVEKLKQINNVRWSLDIDPSDLF